MKRTVPAELAIGAAAVVSVLLMLLFNSWNAHLRLFEIKKMLSRENTVSTPIDHTGLILQYYARMEQYRNKMDPYTADVVEVRASSMFAGVSDDDRDDSAFLLFVSDLIRLPLGLTSVSPAGIKNRYALETAYYYEKNSLYEKAYAAYDQVLKQFRIDPLLRGGIVLHQGFCLSMTGDIRGAQDCYRNVIQDYPADSVSITASILLSYLENFSREADMVRMTPDSPAKAEKLFHLIAINDSLSLIHKIEAEGSPASENLLLYKARCLEAVGDSAGAVSVYRSIIAGNHSSAFAGAAKRRILIIRAKSGDLFSNQPVSSGIAMDEDKETKRFLEECRKVSAGYSAGKAAAPEAVNSVEKTKAAKEAGAAEIHKKNYVSITTSSGDTVKGFVSEEDAQSITIDTEAGSIMVRKSSIVKRRNE